MRDPHKVLAEIRQRILENWRGKTPPLIKLNKEEFEEFEIAMRTQQPPIAARSKEYKGILYMGADVVFDGGENTD